MSDKARTETKVLTRHRQNLSPLTGVRFLAATYVVLYHSRLSVVLAEHRKPLASHFIGNGYMAVPTFFLLSGFILAYTYSGQIETRKDRVRFFEARFARIWPAYVFSLLCSSLSPLGTPTMGLVIANLFMVQSWNPVHPLYADTWSPVSWTLSVEAFFYLCFPMLQTWIEQRSLRVMQFFGATALLVAVAANTAAKVQGVVLYGGIFRFLPTPVIHLPEFMIGVAMGNLFLKRSSKQSLGERGWRTHLGLFLAVTIALTTPRGPWISTALFGLALFVYGLATERTRIARVLSTRALVVGGGISYSMYLLQTPVRLWVSAGLARTHIEGGLLHMVCTLLALILLALATFFGLEEPLRKLLRAWFAASAGRRPATLK